MSQYSKYNRDIKNWAVARARQMNFMMNSLNIHQTGQLFTSLRASVDTYYGKADAIRFKFPRYGVFVEKGVGRGYPIESVKGNGASLDSGKRRSPKSWFSNAITDQDINELAHIAGINLEEINVKLIKSSFKDKGITVSGNQSLGMADVAHLSDFEQAAFAKYYLGE